MRKLYLYLMKLAPLSLAFLAVISCLLFSCKKDEPGPPVLNTSFEYLKNGMRFTASFNNVPNEEVKESGFVWGTSDNPTKSNSFVYVSGVPATNFSQSIFSGFVEKTIYFLRSYYIDKNNAIQYSQPVSFEGRISTGITVGTDRGQYTWGDQVELKVTADQAADLKQAVIYLNGTTKVATLKIAETSLFFVIPNELRNHLNTVSLEIYGQLGPPVPFYLYEPVIDRQLTIVGKVGDIIKISGKFFNPLIENNLVMIGTNKLEVIKASGTELEVKLNDAEFAYSGELKLETGTNLKTQSETQSRVYKYFSPMSDFPGKERYNGTVVQANGKIYCGFGFDNQNVGLNDLWEYSPPDNKWNRMADFPGQLYGGGGAFVTQNKIYIIPEYVNLYRTNEMYKFDPVSNAWTKVASYFNSITRDYSVFSGDRYGYMICGSIDIGGGYLETLKLVHRYDPVTDTWVRLPDFPGTKRRGQKVFKVGNKIILFGGASLTPHGPVSYPSDCWSFDLTSEKWTQINTVPSYINAAGSFSFELNGKAYIGGGMDLDDKISSELYEFDVSTNNFSKKENIFDNIWTYAGAQGIGNKAYVLFGTNQFGQSKRVAKEMFEFAP